MFKRYRFKVEKSNKGFIFSLSDHQPVWVVICEGISFLILLGALYINFKQYF